MSFMATDFRVVIHQAGNSVEYAVRVSFKCDYVILCDDSCSPVEFVSHLTLRSMKWVIIG